MQILPTGFLEKYTTTVSGMIHIDFSNVISSISSTRQKKIMQMVLSSLRCSYLSEYGLSRALAAYSDFPDKVYGINYTSSKEGNTVGVHVPQ